MDGGLTEQLEFYFGDVNLSRDRFLRSEIEGSEDGFVEITVLQTFNKLKATGATEEEIAIAATKSELLELDPATSNKIKRKLPLPPKRSEETACTIYVERLPASTTHSSVKTMFAKYGAVLFVSLPRHTPPSRLVGIKGFAFVEFGVAAHADAAVAALEPGIKSKTAVRAMHKTEWDRLKEEYKILQKHGRGGKRPAAADGRAGGRGSRGGSEGGNRNGKSHEPPQKRSRNARAASKRSDLEAVPGVLVAVSNVPNAGTRTSIKEIFESFGSPPVYVDFKKGKTNAIVRFRDPETASKAVASCAGAVRSSASGGAGGGSASTADDSVIQARLLVGADEKSYWEGLGAGGIAALTASSASSSSLASAPASIPKQRNACSSSGKINGGASGVAGGSGDAGGGGGGGETDGKRRKKSGKLKAKRTHITFDD